ncbi:hypothetical protein ACP70R_007807 [Stipagrostis hirtigluma subsp. patula]
MKRLKLLAMAIAVGSAVIFFLMTTTALQVAASVVEHTFIVSQVNMTHLCKETLITVVNGQLPGPVIEVTEGDTVVVHVINRSPYNITIHWHGVKQQLNCWADGVPMITQCPIQPNHNFTYRFDVAGQEGTLWWHAHAAFLRATLHGAFIIRPRQGTSSYPFPKPDREIPIIIGEWWDKDDITLVDMDMVDDIAVLPDDDPSASTINGKLGDLYNCSGVAESGYELDLEPGKTCLLRVINAALYSEYYLKIAGHKFTVVAADANYVDPYPTDVLAVAPGETLDALVVADAPPSSRYYMVALPNQAPKPDPQGPEHVTRAIVRYTGGSQSHGDGAAAAATDDVPVAPEMPDQHDTMTSFYFHGNLTSLRHERQRGLAQVADEHLFITLGLGSVCRNGQYSCKREGGEGPEVIIVATINNISYHRPALAAPLLESHYYRSTSTMDVLQELPDRPPRVFNFTDETLIPFGPKEARLEATSRGMVARWFRHGAVVDVVFQNMAVMSSDSNPMHLHGHDMFVLAQGVGNFEAAKDVAKYNLVNPPLRNTVLVPRLGWAAVRFVADNPGIWYMHCHYEFHLSMGMAALFIVEDGPTVDTSLPPPPKDFQTCGHDDRLMQDKFYSQSTESEVPHISGV